MILFLLGSGVSPAPKVRALSDAVLSAHLELQSNGVFYPGLPRSSEVNPTSQPKHGEDQRAKR